MVWPTLGLKTTKELTSNCMKSHEAIATDIIASYTHDLSLYNS